MSAIDCSHIFVPLGSIGAGLQVVYCTSQFAVDVVPNTGAYSWMVPPTIDDTLAYRVFLRDPVTRVETNSSLFYVTPYLRAVPTRWGRRRAGGGWGRGGGGGLG